ncbi:MAG: ABC transporter ATP-binding protein [Deltaproteobacteria bacterium]|nr:ABC transporter ATP-binding protein [Deltaproteobacteria bacterium]
MVSPNISNQQRAGAAIRCEAVSRSFSGTGLVLDRISYRVEPGEFVALLGPSGSGKSSLLRLTAGLDQPDSGQLAIEASDGPVSRGFVFQDATLLPWRTVLGNTTLPLELSGWSRADAQSRATEELCRVGLAEFGARYPHELSGGMKMRTSVARALTTRPNLLLLDEPFAALDEPTRHSLQMQLREIWLALGMTVLFVTHSVSEAVFLADRIIVLSQRPARLLLDQKVLLPKKRDAELRTSLRYIEQVRAIAAAMPVSGDAS